MAIHPSPILGEGCMLYRYFMFHTLLASLVTCWTRPNTRRTVLLGLCCGLVAGGAHAVLAAADPSYGLTTTARTVGINTGSSATSLPQLVGAIIKTLLGLTGVLFLGMVVVAGDYWITAGGNEKQVEEAQTMIKNGVVGMVVVFAAYALTVFVLDQILSYAGL